MALGLALGVMDLQGEIWLSLKVCTIWQCLHRKGGVRTLTKMVTQADLGRSDSKMLSVRQMTRVRTDGKSVLARATEESKRDRGTHGQTTDGGLAGRWTPPPPPSSCRLRLEDEPSLQGHGRGAPHQGRPAGALCPPGRGALMRAPLQ